MLIRIQYLKRSILCLNLTNIITHTLEQCEKEREREKKNMRLIQKYMKDEYM